LLTEAREAFGKALELAPQRIVIRMVLAIISVGLGEPDRALSEIETEPEEWARLCGLGAIHALTGNRAASGEALRKLTEKYAENSAYQIAAVHGTRAETDAVFQWLERAYAQRDPGLAYVKMEPMFASAHADPRWGEFLKKMGLAD